MDLLSERTNGREKCFKGNKSTLTRPLQQCFIALSHLPGPSEVVFDAICFNPSLAHKAARNKRTGEKTMNLLCAERASLTFSYFALLDLESRQGKKRK